MYRKMTDYIYQTYVAYNNNNNNNNNQICKAPYAKLQWRWWRSQSCGI